MKFSLLPVSQIAPAIPAILTYLGMSAQASRGRASVEDILRFLLNGQMALWLAYEQADGEPAVVHGFIATEIKQYPQCKMLVIQYCAGRTGALEAADDLVQQTLERFASDAGCAGIEFIGRPGWRGAARKFGYEVQSVMYQKFFEVGQ